MATYWKKLKACECDDDPYSDACDYCLAKRRVDGYYKDSQIKVICKYCNGRGFFLAPDDVAETCSHCNGTGEAE